MRLFPTDSNGIPSQQDCANFEWGIYQLSIAAANAYQNLYSNVNGLRDSMADFWRLVATEFSGYPNVLGYELMNEPFTGDVFNNPTLLIPGFGDRVNLQEFYNIMSDAIRSVDKEKFILFEPVTWDNFRVGFSDTPGNLYV